MNCMKKVSKSLFNFLALLLVTSTLSCQTTNEQAGEVAVLTSSPDSIVGCSTNLPSRFQVAEKNPLTGDTAVMETSTEGMTYISGGTFMMGGDNDQARADEFPKHQVRVDGFWMDEHEVTNAQFREFVNATGYVTTAEQKPDWEEMKKQLPPGTPRPPDEVDRKSVV